MKSAIKLKCTFTDDEGKWDFDPSEQVSRLLQMPAGVSEHCSVVIRMIMIIMMTSVMVMMGMIIKTMLVMMMMLTMMMMMMM